MSAIVENRRIAPQNEGPAPELQIYRPPMPTIEGFVDVRLDHQRKNYNFEGLLIPHMDRNNEARNRFLLLDRHAPEWFKDLCLEITEQNHALELCGLGPIKMRQERMQVRMKLVSLPGGTSTGVAFLAPLANSAEQAHEEWKFYKEQIDALPKTLDECKTKSQVAWLVYEYVSSKMDLRVLRHNILEDTAIGVSPNGTLVRLSGAAKIWEARHEIETGAVSLDEVIRNNVEHFRVVERRGL